jgi:hypothetical protein
MPSTLHEKRNRLSQYALRKRQAFLDLSFIIVTIIVAFMIVQTGTLGDFLKFFNSMAYLGVFVAGFFFTSAFTTAFAIVTLGAFAHEIPLIPLALIGACGAVLGDYILFRFMKDRIADDISYFISAKKRKKIATFFTSGVFRFFVPSIAAIIIASPLPDELGVSLLGISKTNSIFFVISFLFNAIGILLIGYTAKALL